MPTVNRTNPTAPASNTTTATPQSYTVQSGDTLSRIAARYGVSVEQLQNVNQGRYPGITNPRSLQVGWNLTIPAGGRTQPGGTTTPTPPQTTTQGWAPRSNDKVLFVAVNNSDAHRSTLESDALRNRGTDISVIQDSRVPDQITTRDANGRSTTHDLTQEQGRMNFALTLGLPADQTRRIADVIGRAGPDAKDEMAAIAQEWAKAERGGQIPSRLVLSGHHVGSGVYGENNGQLDWPVVAELAQAMPRAARSVEDLLIAGCYSGGHEMMEKYASMFPNVKTITAYEGSSPGAASGAVAHQRVWEQQTRGSGEQRLNENAYRHMRKGENVSVWTRSGGMQGEAPAPLETLRANMEAGRAAYNDALAGRTTIANPQTGPIREFYNHTQRLLQHPNLPADEKARLTAQRDQTIRLLFLPVVSQRFQQTYSDRIQGAYQELGLQAPDFSRLSRAQQLAEIQRFQEAAAARPNAGPNVTRMAPILRDFGNLDPRVIPDTWI